MQDMDHNWTVQDDRLKGSLEGVVEHPCTAHQLTAAIFMAWKDFLVPEKGFTRLTECQPRFWCAFAPSGRMRPSWQDAQVSRRALSGGALISITITLLQLMTELICMGQPRMKLYS